MAPLLTIPRHETGVTRVFSLSMSSQEALHLKDDVGLLAKALGAPPANESGVEVFPLADLGELGLAGYLQEGVDARPEDIARDKAKLSALDGWVLLLHSTAFSPAGATLAPVAALTLIGTYKQAAAENDALPLEAETAKPYSGTVPAAPPEKAQLRTPASWIIAGLVFVSAAIVLWAFGLSW